MSALATPHVLIWFICAVSILGVIVRPWQLPEALWAVLGALALVACSLLSPAEAIRAVGKGTDVYLFLVGMMVLAEFARHEGLFDWLAALAVRQARGSAGRLFALVYGVGTLVTVLLSNDATAVVLTPAVYAAAQRAEAPPLPYLFTCAFIANAASFVLPISNPANLVVFGVHMPSLGNWLTQFGLASLASIAVTYAVLWASQRAVLRTAIAVASSVPPLSQGGRLAGAGTAMTALVLLVASSLGWSLGLPTFVAGVGTGIVVLLRQRTRPWLLIKDISWSVLPLVAGLFVLVDGVQHTGVLAAFGARLARHSAQLPALTAFLSGTVAAVTCNLINNLPLGLIAGTVAAGSALPPPLTGALLIGVDLGPNLSVTGSLATILWLLALRREGQQVSAWKFLALGALVMPPALVAALVSFVGLPLR